MDANKTVKLNLVPNKIQEPLGLLVEKLVIDLTDNLKSVTVVGSSLTEDYRPEKSDINTVLVLGKRSMSALNSIASLAKPMSKKKLSPPLLMTQSYIQRSVDVFGVEFLDFQLTHQTILGDDPFAGLQFNKKDVRLQCERELKAMLIRLRQGFIAARANRKLVRDVLIAASKSLAPILRAMLWLKDIVRPITTSSTFSKAAGEFSLHVGPISTVDEWRISKIKPSQIQVQDTFEALYTTVEQLADKVDSLEV